MNIQIYLIGIAYVLLVRFIPTYSLFAQISQSIESLALSLVPGGFGVGSDRLGAPSRRPVSFVV